MWTARAPETGAVSSAQAHGALTDALPLTCDVRAGGMFRPNPWGKNPELFGSDPSSFLPPVRFGFPLEEREASDLDPRLFSSADSLLHGSVAAFRVSRDRETGGGHMLCTMRAYVGAFAHSLTEGVLQER